MPEIVSPKQIEYLKKLRFEQNEFTLEMEAFAKQHKIPILNWACAEFMEQLVLLHKPKRVLEIGTAIAYTTIRIAGNLSESAIIDTIELSKHNIPLAKDYIKRSGLSDKINLLEGNAFNVIPTLKNKYDMIFLDADKVDYISMFELAIELLKKGGLVVVDNVLWQGYPASTKIPRKYKASTEHVRKFNEMFVAHPKLKTSILAIGDGMAIGIKVF